ncbi:hypothetical protein Hanom_Chr10g00873931 [Helianthus anomalus]
MRFLGRNLEKALPGPCYDVLLVSNFDLTGRTHKTETRSQSYVRFRKTPLEARSWASRNVMVRSSTLGPASIHSSFVLHCWIKFKHYRRPKLATIGSHRTRDITIP